MRPPTVGVFDSGVGGLSIWREIAWQLPSADLIYVADQAHCPYGLRPRDEVQVLAGEIAAFLIDRGADVVVVACNTASAAALHALRERFRVPIVGMEPAVKPAAAHTRSGHVGVIATQVTFQGELFASLLERFAQGVTVHTQVCPGLVEQVEAGKLEDGETLALVRRYLAPLREAGVDTLVLGCTHYAFLRPVLSRVAGNAVAIIDPAPAVARQTGRVLSQVRPDAPCDRKGRWLLYTSGDIGPFQHAMRQLLGRSGDVRAVWWEQAGQLVSSDL